MIAHGRLQPHKSRGLTHSAHQHMHTLLTAPSYPHPTTPNYLRTHRNTMAEAAGLALAVFPVLIKGMSDYRKGLRTIGDWQKYRGQLSRLVRQLEMEQVKFENTCVSLLEGVVTAEKATALMAGTGWDDPEFQEILNQHLQPRLANAFADAVVALNSYLQLLSKDIGAVESCMVCLSPSVHQDLS